MVDRSPYLILGYGNRSRGDDALAGAFLDAIAPQIDANLFEIIEDFQLNIEHTLDIINRKQVLLIDAAVNLNKPFVFQQISPQTEIGYSSHALSPEALLGLCHQLAFKPIPPVFMLAIEGDDFSLGAPLSCHALANLTQALTFSERLLRHRDHHDWQRLTSAQSKTSDPDFETMTVN